MIDEERGRRVLRRAFSDAGYRIEEDYPLQIAGTVILVDGYDPVRKVGYEYVTTEAGDRRNIDAHVLAELEKRNEQRQLHILMLDEQFVESEEELAYVCKAYLEEISDGV